MYSKIAKESGGPFRALLTEVLPRELPLNFSNQGLLRYLQSINFRVENKQVLATFPDKTAVTILSILLSQKIKIDKCNSDGTCESKFPLESLKKSSVPLTFEIRKDLDENRQLAIPHPANQIVVAHIYEEYAQRLLAHTNLSRFSIRRPVETIKNTGLKTSYFKNDRVSGVDAQDVHGSIEVSNPYFRYKEFDFLYKFYKSQHFTDQELKFNFLLKLDIQKCFESIYTHSIEWAIYGKQNIKTSLRDGNKDRFGAILDKVVQNFNDAETHGILIGSEFARIFTEIILQRIDVEIERELLQVGLKIHEDYQIFRYVDDFFIFVRSEENQNLILPVIERQLRPYRLHLNRSKQQTFPLPYISNASIFFQWFDEILDKAYVAGKNSGLSNCSRRPLRQLFDGYKAQLSVLKLLPRDAANYGITRVENKIIELGDDFLKQEKEVHDTSKSNECFMAVKELIEFSFYICSGSPMALTIFKLAKCCSLARRIITKLEVSFEAEQEFESLIFHQTVQLMNKNPLRQNSPVETLYLLSILSEQRSSFSLTESQLIKFLGFENVQGQLKIVDWVNSLMILQLLDYLVFIPGNYPELLEGVEEWILKKITSLKGNPRNFAEEPILTISTLTCPVISASTKEKIFQMYDDSLPTDWETEFVSAKYSFMDWGNTDIYDRILKQPSHELY